MTRTEELIPAPVSCRPVEGVSYPIDAGTTICAGPGTEGVAGWLRSVLGAATGLALPPGDGGITLEVDDALAAEGYRLTADDRGVRLVGGSAAGVFWGAQTLRQLLGPRAYRRAPVDPAARWRVPGVEIEDAPRFGWRGMMLDVARHFMPKDGVLRYLDLLAAHKLNVLHLHLTDDQGWRIEIARYPELTRVGAWRERTKVGLRDSQLWDERPHGGYYTQDDIREIVAYAADRHITVVPEIDIPGHSQAAIAAYPELGNTDVVDTTALDPWTAWGVNPNVLGVSDATLAFYENVFAEVLDLFPSPFVHIGGDECPKDQWRDSPAAQQRIRDLGLADEDELQSWFVRHFDNWLAERGRRLVGWDEILEGGRRAEGRAPVESDEEKEARNERPYDEERRQGVWGYLPGEALGEPGGETTELGLAPGATVSSWRGYAGGVAAARSGHDVVMCPEQHVYLDWRQADGPDEPVPIAHVRTLADVYRFEPVPQGLTPEQAAHVIGAQANAWTEVMDSARVVDYMSFPRLCAFAEVVWSALPAPAERDLAGFEGRMAGAHYGRLDALGVEYRPPGGPHPWQRRPGVVGRPMDGPPPVR